jgi:excisionase family DNA binding protein
MHEEEILNKKQLAAMLHISERTIERWITEARIPYVRLPRRGAWSEIRFLRSNILTWLTKHEVKPSKFFRSHGKDKNEPEE